jgi:hypothetical protein
MGRPNQLVEALGVIEEYFGKGDHWAFTERRLSLLLIEQREHWGLSYKRSPKKIIEFLLRQNLLVEHELRMENHVVLIYSWRTTDEFTVVTGLNYGGYFAYYSALFVLGLTQQLPRTYYLNHERAAFSSSYIDWEISQEAIDQTFAGEQRRSGQVYLLGNKRAVVTNGKYTDRLGVRLSKSDKQCFYHTDLERTLIDCVVRPGYAGGVAEVLTAFKLVLGKLNVERLFKYLKKLDYVYPYQQAIGFYLEKAGYGEAQLALFDTEKEFDFYLTYNITTKAYSDRWRLFYPRGL